jgi:hypothetical protein
MDSVTTLLLVWLGVTLAVLGMSFVNMLGLTRVVDHLRLSSPEHWSEEKFESFMNLASQNLTMLLFVTVFVVEILSLLFVDVRSWLGEHPYMAGLVYGVPLLGVTLVWVLGQTASSGQGEEGQGEEGKGEEGQGEEGKGEDAEEEE